MSVQYFGSSSTSSFRFRDDLTNRTFCLSANGEQDRVCLDQYDRIVGALANLGHRVSDQTVGNVLRRHGISPAPKRKQSVSWANFIRSHRDVLVGMDFFTTEVLTLKGLTTYYVLFFIHLATRRVNLAGLAPWRSLRGRHPHFWMAHKPQTMSEVYSHLHEELQLRLDEAERVGYGFVLPKSSIVPIAPKSQGKKMEVNTA